MWQEGVNHTRVLRTELRLEDALDKEKSGDVEIRGFLHWQPKTLTPDVGGKWRLNVCSVCLRASYYMMIFVCMGLTYVTAQIWLFRRDCQVGNLAEGIENSQRQTQIQTQNNKK